MPATRAGVVSGDRRVDFVPSAHQNAPLADRSRRIRGGADRRWREIRAAMSFPAAIIVEGVLGVTRGDSAYRAYGCTTSGGGG